MEFDLTDASLAVFNLISKSSDQLKIFLNKYKIVMMVNHPEWQKMFMIQDKAKFNKLKNREKTLKDRLERMLNQEQLTTNEE